MALPIPARTRKNLKIAVILKLADELELDMRWDAFAKTTLSQERKFKPVLRDRFRKQKADVLKRIKDNPPPEERSVKAPSDIYTPWLFDEGEWSTKLEDAARPFIEGSMKEGAAEAILDVNAALDISLALDLDVRDPRIERIIADKLQEFSFEVNNETTKLLKKEFQEALRDGDSIPLIQKRVEKVFGFTSRVRTERIARTEIVGAHNAGGHEAKVQSGVVKEKKWIDSRDADVRPSHAAGTGVGGEVVPLKEPYSNGLMFPGDWMNGSPADIIN